MKVSRNEYIMDMLIRFSIIQGIHRKLFKVVDLLLEHGANPKLIDDCHMTCLHAVPCYNVGEVFNRKYKACSIEIFCYRIVLSFWKNLLSFLIFKSSTNLLSAIIFCFHGSVLSLWKLFQEKTSKS